MQSEGHAIFRIEDAGRWHDAADVVVVRYTRFGEERLVQARRGVVLAAGGFSMNQEMLERHCPRLAQKGVVKQGCPSDDGAAIEMGIAAGGTGVHLDGALVTAPFYPPESLLKGILVNERGDRFVNEDCYHARSLDAALRQPRGIARYNEMARAGCDDDFHKHTDWLQPIEQAPFAALEFSLGKAVYIGFTLGGLAVSSDAEVVDASGEPVPGLDAAGACASNIAHDGKGYSSGTCIGEATYFGRRAGRHVAARS